MKMQVSSRSCSPCSWLLSPTRPRRNSPAFRQNRKVLSAGRTAAYSGVFPGYTVNQIIRLNDAALDSNKVEVQRDKGLAFLAFNLVLTANQRKAYQKDPE